MHELAGIRSRLSFPYLCCDLSSGMSETPEHWSDDGATAQPYFLVEEDPGNQVSEALVSKTSGLVTVLTTSRIAPCVLDHRESLSFRHNRSIQISTTAAVTGA